MTQQDELLAELLDRPVGPAVAKRTRTIEPFTKEISISGNTAVVEIADESANEGTALRFLVAEGQSPDDWEVSHFRRIEYGNGMTSVRFSFKRIAVNNPDELPPEIVNSWRESLLAMPGTPEPVESTEDATYVVLVADPQLGKKGTQEAVENWRRGILGHVAAIEALRGQVSRVHVAFMGDETENVVNSYTNQPHTIELNRSQQLELDYDLRVWTMREALSLGLPVTASSVVSNHGEWTRNGGKDPVTTSSDNASTFVARQVKALFDELEPFTGQSIDWVIGEGAPGVVVNLSGVDCYFSHGYIEKGRGGSTEIRTKVAIERQILGRTDTLASVKLWFMAHYHHLYTNEFEGRTLFGCPALEAERSSEYMLDGFGVWSPPGMLGALVSDQFSRGYSQINVV